MDAGKYFKSFLNLRLLYMMLSTQFPFSQLFLPCLEGNVTSNLFDK